MADPGDHELSQHEAYAVGVKHLFESGALSDLTVTCQGRKWKVHKLQLCAQSEYFLKMFNGQFKEAKESLLNLDEEEPHAVEAMLHYLYFGDYTKSCDALSGLLPIVLDVKMRILADKYLIPTLETTALKNFNMRCSREWNTANFAAAIRAVYQAEADDPDLKEIIIKTIRDHIDRLLAKNVEYPDFHSAMNEVTELGVDILHGLAAEGYFKAGKKMQTESEWMFECPQCSWSFTQTIPVGYSTSFTCPTGCYKNSKVFSWWQKHAV